MSDHLIQVRYSQDARNWTSWRDLNAGRVGAFGQELVARQLGQATWRVWETCDTSPFAADILAAAIQADGSGNWSDFPLPDGGYSDLTRDWTLQDLENYIPLPAQQAGTRSRVLYRTAPGLDVFANVGAGPHRGALNAEGSLFVVSGSSLYEVAKDGTATSRGTIPGTGRVSMAYNQITGGNQVVIGNGSSGYVYNTYTGAFTQITDDGFVGFKSCDFLNQYIVGVEPLGRFWYHSDLVDALSYNTLDRYVAETSPDPIQGLIASHNEVLVFGGRTIEPWVNDPESNAAGTAFQLERGSVIERGCINGATIRRLDNSVFFVGDDRVPYRLNGYTPVPIGTPVLAAAWRDLKPEKAFAFTYEDRGHVIYYVTWGDGQTWGYDVVTGKWHRRQSFGHDRWCLNTLVKWGNDWYGGDFQNGKLYRLAWDFVYEGCEIMPRRMRTGVLHADGNPVSVGGFKLVASTGGVMSEVGASTPPTISGSLPTAARIGDTVDYQFTITPAFPGQAVTLTISGDLPPGLSINGTGHVTGTYTTDGVYEFTITPASDCAVGTPLRQAVSVGTLTIMLVGAAMTPNASQNADYDDEADGWTAIAHTAMPLLGGFPIYGGGHWVVVGNGAYYTSDVRSSAAWTSIPCPTGTAGNGGAYGNGVFASSGNLGLLWRCANLTTGFTAVTGINPAQQVCGMAYGNGTWIIGTGGGPFYYSTNDLATVTLGSSSAMPYQVSCVQYVGGQWYLGGGTSAAATAGSGLIKSSLTGLSGYTTLVSNAPSRVESFATDGHGKWVAVCWSGEIIYTDNDWQTWTQSATTTSSSAFGSSRVVFNGVHFVITDDNGAAAAVSKRSLTGATWDTVVSTGLDGSINLAVGR
jgi:hypothetical protein